MKKIALYSLLSAPLFALSALEPGGVSMDFSAIKPIEQKAAEGVNYVKNADFSVSDKNLDKGGWTGRWAGTFYVHGGTAEEKQKFPRFGVRKIENGTALLQTPLTAQKERDEKGRPMISNRINQIIEIPVADHPRKMRVSMKAKGKIEPVAGLNNFIGFATCSRINEKKRSEQIGGMTQKTLPVNSEFRECFYDFVVPAGAARVAISLALYGIGEVVIDDVSARFVEAPECVEAISYPSGMLDRKFVTGSKQPGTVVFVFRNDTGRSAKNLKLRLELPDGFRFLDTHMLAKVEKNQNNEVIIDWSKAGIRPGSWETWFSLPVLLTNDLAPGSKVAPLRYQVLENGAKGPVNTLDMEVIAPIAGGTPKEFKTACMFSHESNFAGPGAGIFVDFYRLLGFNAVHGGSSVPVQKQFGKAGVERFTQAFYLCNGYRLGDRKKSDAVRFRLMDGTSPDAHSICPTAVYTEHNEFLAQVPPMLERILVTGDLADSIMSNWELHHYDFKGCFCNTCRDEFVKHMKGKASAAEIQAKWPREIVAAYRNDWIRFRSLQHAKLMRTLNKHISAAGKKAGKKSVFAPELAWSSFIDYDREHYAQYDPADYLKDFEWVEPWGPYIFWNVQEPYLYYPGLHLITHAAAAEIRKNAPDSKLIAFPHGIQCGTWFTEPEAVAFEFLTFFVNRWNGAFGYYYPKGYDFRHLKASAGANRMIAQYEDFVLKGRVVTGDIAVKAETPMPKPFFPNFWSEGGNFTKKLPKLKDIHMLQYEGFERNGSILVALGNFWQKGECFATVGVKNLKSAQSYRVMLDDRNLGDFTGAALAKGILTHVGALRWSFLQITPAKGAATNVLTQNEMRSLMTKRLPAIRKACEWEQKYDAAYRAAASSDHVSNDFKAFYPVHNGAVTMKAEGERIVVTSPNYALTLDPAAGGRIEKLTCNKEELVLAGGLGIAGFWKPAAMIANGFKIVNSGSAGRNIRLELERTLSARDCRELAGLKVTRTYLFGEKEFTMSATVSNPTNTARDFSFRYQSFPAGLGSRNGLNGRATFGDGQSFQRDYKVRLCTFAPDDPKVNKAHRVETVMPVQSHEVTFSAPFLKTALRAVPDKNALQSFVFWDGSSPCAPFEPIYRHIQLKPKASVTYTMSCIPTAR